MVKPKLRIDFNFEKESTKDKIINFLSKTVSRPHDQRGPNFF